MKYRPGTRHHLSVYGCIPIMAHFIQALVQAKQRVGLVAPIDPRWWPGTVTARF
ncbi:protein of unknown function [Candidatus Hydrogenisulfobacillus filiaventi]|uniref:Uncharacterized protein n=1 Tax=Candidatus Hydrogenisulfobacillus filiaventi TaxID=2707344 RepID=A0A6F8ZH60_9FIRM|nr:protein of unknown function [Candidatus Hydrogenisulfobacillus filiaventi]